MKKQEQVKEMQNKLKELEQAEAKLMQIIDNVEDANKEDAERVKELQAELEQVQQESEQATDVNEARELTKKAKELQEDVALQEQVNKTVAGNRNNEIAEAVQEVFAVHKSAKFMYRALEKEFQATVSLRSLQEDNEKLKGFYNQINTTFTNARNILLDFKIVSNAEQNKQYKGTHLGQARIYKDLGTVFTSEALRGEY